MTAEKSTILQVVIQNPLRRSFDYLPPQGLDLSGLQVGMRVKVPFQRRELVGIFMGFLDQSDYPLEKLKKIISIIDDKPLINEDILRLCRWAADYYHYSLGEVLFSALPGHLREGKPPQIKRPEALKKNTNPLPPLALNAAQQAALSAIQAAKETFRVLLLDGITGSGKTEVYLQAIADALQRNQQVLVLVPEIGLTPQTIQRFRERFAVPVLASHSAMTEKQKLQTWLAAKSSEAKIVIGTRSAVFTPFVHLGLIVIDEEHDLSFKQQEGFRYHARDLAIMRAQFNQIPIVLGSATPSLETLHNAKNNRYQHLQLLERAGSAKLPEYHVIDIRNIELQEGLSTPLLQAIKQHLDQEEQVMLFLNRRGFAPVLICHACGWMALCKRCDARMTYHHKMKRLHCHHCDTQKKVIDACEKCGAIDLHAIGHGTERLDNILTQHFPNHSIVRLDRDTTQRKGAMEKFLNEIHAGDHHILIGTQMLAKGHHFPRVTLVGIVDADGGFFSNDFRAVERMGQLILQVAGRAGRDEKPGKVLVQTRHPDHALLQQLLRDNYQQFAMSLLKERAETELPPYTFFALFRAEAYDFSQAMDFLNKIKNCIVSAGCEVLVMGPITASMAKRAGRHRVQLLLQSKKRSDLQRTLNTILPRVEMLPLKSRVRWSLDVDPLEIM